MHEKVLDFLFLVGYDDDMEKIKFVSRTTRRAMISLIDAHKAVLSLEEQKAATEPEWRGAFRYDLSMKRDGLESAKVLWEKVWRANRFRGDEVALREFILACNRAITRNRFKEIPEKPIRRGYGKAISFAESLLAHHVSQCR